MRLEFPLFERRLRKRLRAEIRGDARIKAGSKLRVLQKPLPPWAVQAGISFIFTILLVSVTASSGQPGLGYAALALWATASALRRSRQLQNLLYLSEDIGVLYQLPIADADIFLLQWRKSIQQSGILLLNLLVAYCGLAVIGNSATSALPIAVLSATVQFGLILAIAVHVSAWFPYLPLNAISTVLSGGAFVIIFFWSSFPAAIVDIVNLGYWSSPSGWINYTSVQTSRAGDYQSLLLLFPIGLIIASTRFSFLRLRENYRLHEPVFPLSDPELTEQNVHGFLRPAATLGQTEIHDRITSREFLRSSNWTQFGWLEKITAKMMNPRQQLVAEFLVAAAPRWTAKLRWGMIITALSTIAALFFGEHGGFIIFFPAYLIATALLPLSGNEWRGLQSYPTAGLFAPIYAMYPLGYDEILTVILKVNVLRCAAAFPLLATYGAVAAASLHQPALLGITLAAKVTVAAIALQPLFFALRISSSSNDIRTSRFSWHWFWIVPLMIALAGCTFVVFTAKNDWLAAACLVALSLLSFTIVFVQRQLYRRAKFDLLSARGEAFQI